LTPTFFTTSNWKSRILAALFFCLLLLVVFLSFRLWHTEQEKDSSKEDIKTMSEEHARNINALRNELDINKQNAQELQKEIIRAQQNQKQPDVIYKEIVKEGGSITEHITERIRQNDPTLPPEALAKTDKTVVAEQKDNKEVPVGIYKINTYRNWELGTGIGVHDHDAYIPLSLQRNYSKNRSIALEAHYSLKDHKINGGEIQWKVHF
jgi:hypothetical protein